MNVLSLLPFFNPAHDHDPVVFIVQKFLQKNGIKVNTEDLRTKLWKHPWSSSFLSIHDALEDLGLSPVAYRSSVEELTSNFDAPLIINLSLETDCFLIIDRVSNGKIYALRENGKEMEFSYSEFENFWNGAVIKIEKPNSQSILSNRYLNGINLPLILLSCSLLILATNNIFSNYSNDYIGIIIILINLVGAVLSWLLISEHENNNNPLVSQLCSSETNNGCNAVVHSKYSMITKNISWSDAGFAYFLGLSFSAIIFKQPQSLIYLSLLAPIYSLYAVYIQAFKVKEWCRLCMSVHVIVLINFIYAIASISQTEFSTKQLFSELLFFAIPGLAYLIIKPLFFQLKERKIFKKRYFQLKSNPEIFNQLTKAQEKFEVPDELKVFQMGDLNASNELTMISNPFCGPCAKSHEIIEEWLKSNINFKINMIFTHTHEGKKRDFVSYLSSLSSNESLSDIIDDWYKRGETSIEEWAKKHNLNQVNLPYDDQLHSSWLNSTGINATPTFLVNGYQLPSQYTLSDIKIFLNES